MTSITVDISDEQLQKLKRLAEESNISAEDLLCASIKYWWAYSQDEFTEIVDSLINKEFSGMRLPGIDEGRFVVPDDFDDPLPFDILKSFSG